MNIFWYIFLLAILNYLYELRTTNYKEWVFPHFLVLIFSYVIVFSKIKHKEDRFLLPVFPFIFLVVADFVYKMIVKFVKYKLFIPFMIILGLGIAFEVVLSFAFYEFNELRYRPI